MHKYCHKQERKAKDVANLFEIFHDCAILSTSKDTRHFTVIQRLVTDNSFQFWAKCKINAIIILELKMKPYIYVKSSIILKVK